MNYNQLQITIKHLTTYKHRVSSIENRVFSYLHAYYLRASKAPLHLSRELYKSPLFMQNKPKVKIGKMNITSFNRMDYENKSNWTLGKSGKNKAKQTQIQNR